MIFGKISYFIEFDNFSLEIRVDEESSVNYSRRFRGGDAQFVFVVAEVWLHQSGVMRLIIPSSRPGNFLEEIKDLVARVLSPPLVPGIEQVIACGGWSFWMSGYWIRVEGDCNFHDDEIRYDRLSLALFDEREFGYIAIYKFNGKNIFEVSSRGEDVVGVWSEFDSSVLRNQLVSLRGSIYSAVHQVLILADRFEK